MDSFWSRSCLNLGQAVSMKRTLFSLTMPLLPGALYAQDQDSEKLFRYNGYGYAFFSGGASQHAYRNVGAGGGGEGFLWRGLTLGGEIGYFRFPADRNAGYGVFTIGPGYHFVNRSEPARIDPYVHVGLIGGVLAPCCFARAGSVGGGVNYWFKEKLGLQIGGQLQVLAVEEAVVAFRIGLTFR